MGKVLLGLKEMEEEMKRSPEFPMYLGVALNLAFFSAIIMAILYYVF